VAATLVIALVMSSLPAQAATSLPANVLAAAEPTMQDVRVNRTVPTVARPSPGPVFSASPDAREITAARVFEEPLLPVGPEPSVNENAALARALRAYVGGGGRDRVAPLVAFLAGHRESPWRASLLVNLGLVIRRTGYFSRALESWEEAWTLTRAEADPDARPVGDRAIGELFELNARLGRFDRLEQLLQEIDGRDVRGSAAAKLSGARQALWQMRNAPEHSFRCGPLALDQVLRHGRADYQTPDAVAMCPSTSRGTSMTQMRDLATSAGRSMVIGFRPAGAEAVVPSMVHWRVGHFAALVDQSGDRVLVRDATFGDEFWVTLAALDAEASGYFLIHGASVPPSWRSVPEEEGAAVWGKGHPTGNDDDDLGCPPECGPPGRGMAEVSMHMMLVSTIVRDTPVWYAPPRGQPMDFEVRYNQRDPAQPQTFPYANLGTRWTFDWFSYIEDDPANPAAAVKVYFRGGGREASTGYSAATQKYAATVRTQAVITRTSSNPIRYERELPDGSVEVFAQPDGVATFPRKVFITEMRDPQGNAVTFTWDAQLRLVAAADAVGQVTTIAYEHPTDPLKITKVTDPFGRTATFAYGSDGRLASITDLLGLVSSFTYGPADALTAVTTPYGTTTITQGQENLRRWIEMTDPAGGKERLEYGLPLASSSGQPAPTGMVVGNMAGLNNTTFYWDRRAMAVAPGLPSSATQYVWALVSSGLAQTSAGVHGLKRPLENWVWTNYHGVTGSTEGTLRKPAKVGRILDDLTSQVTQADYNSRGMLAKQIDPVGRETAYEYAANGLDLTAIKQKNGAGWDLLETRTYNGQHLPLTVTDASGQTTTYTYNAAGQVLTVTNAKNETTTYAYDANGRLQSITGAVAGATTTFTYDALSRVRTVTDADNYTVTTDYDAAGRPTRTTYPDGTYDETTYSRLDAVRRRDRLGRITHFFYDAARRLTATRDPLGRTVTQDWCGCGSLDALIDANGNRTRWERDVQGRVTKEVRADGRQTLHAYENTTSRLKSVTDAKGQVTTYNYFLDDRLKDLAYTNEQIATPDVSFTYDATYGRLSTMLDGTGTTTYGYHVVAPPALGATRLASVDGPLGNDTITYGYDQLGRVTTRAINGVGVTWSFDALGRVTTEVNALGTFTYTYDGPTDRIATVAYPNGQTSTYSYYPNAQDHRLQTIHHQYPNTATLSKFDYTYNAVGNILTWRQQADTTAVLWEYGYDAADQLTTAVKRATDPQQTVLKRYGYAYDPAGNRTIEQIDDQVTGSTYNTVNELVTQSAAGAMAFEGTVNEPATVTIAGKPASVSATNQFRGTAPVTSGTNTVTISATDPSGNVATKQYQVGNTATSKAFTYDANGNLTADGTRTFEWDARNQMVAVNVGTKRSEFTYDGRQRRIRIVEKESGVTQSDTKLVWCENEICEERATDGTTVTRRAFERGEQVAGAARFLAPDHLGTVEDVTDGTSAVLARYAFDPWGRRTVTAGTDVTSVGYAGYRWQSNSSLSLTLFRGYDADLGRWVSQDPLGIQGGTNFFAYAENNSIRFTDPLGLAIWICSRAAWRGWVIEGAGNHSYLWDDRNNQCCGRGSQNQCKEGGPGVDPCRRIDGSDGNEDKVMGCCRRTADLLPWIVSDCHSATNRCITAFGLKNPGAPGGRIGDRCNSCD
jgi:RHS repeat-associated protein